MRKLLYGVCFLLLFILSSTSEAVTKEDLRIHATVMEYKYDLPKGLLVNICRTESNWRNVRGQLDEIGVCQIRPGTVRHLFPEYSKAVTKYLHYGTKGLLVVKVQSYLSRIGTYNGAIDGIWGPRTDRAVRKFQEENSLKVDGIIGPVTWRTMFGTDYPNQSVEQRLWNPKQNIEIAARIIKHLHDTVSTNPAIIAAAYNGGAGHPIVQYMKRVLE